MERQGVVGIDVSKVRLDVAYLLKRELPECVALETTGGHELNLLEDLLRERADSGGERAASAGVDHTAESNSVSASQRRR